MPKLRLIALFASLFLFSLSVNSWSAGANAETKSTSRELEPLGPQSGYLLMGVAAKNSDASLKYAKYRNNRLSRNTTNLDLGHVESGFLLIPLKAGDYHITEVLAPYYDLPFKLEVKDKPAWKFHIKAGRVNYIGSVLVKAERSKNNVDIRWLNRLAFSLKDIESEFEAELELYPLATGVAYEDTFWEALKEGHDE